MVLSLDKDYYNLLDESAGQLPLVECDAFCA